MQQISIFDLLYEKYQITKPIRLIELFSGYGSQALALKYLGVKFTHWRICEWATKSIQAYNDLHIRDYTDYSKNFTTDEIIESLLAYGISYDYNNPMTLNQIKRKGETWQRQTYNNIIATHNLVDISKAKAKDLNINDTNKYEYILTYSFPCQDLSLAGKGEGMRKGGKTRSGLLWQVERLLSELDELPQILLMENVPQINSPKNKNDFRLWQQKLEELGYTNNIKVLNAKDYCIPQHRQRCFMVSILGNQHFNFAKEMKLTNPLAAILEHNVDDKYIISNDKIKELIKPVATKDIILKQVIQLEGKFESIGRVYSIDGLAPTINTCGGGQREPKIFDTTVCLNPKVNGKQPSLTNRIYDINGCMPAVTTFPFFMGSILVKEATKKGYAEAHEGDSINLEHPNSNTRRGRVGKGVAQTLLTNCNQAVVVNTNNKSLIELIKKTQFNENETLFLDAYNQIINNKMAGTITTRIDASNATFIYNNLIIRKLTPKECWRLMGVKDADYNNVAANQSNSSLYHLAGDSIVTTVLMAIFGELLDVDYETKIADLVEDLKECS